MGKYLLIKNEKLGTFGDFIKEHLSVLVPSEPLAEVMDDDLKIWLFETAGMAESLSAMIYMTASEMIKDASKSAAPPVMEDFIREMRQTVIDAVDIGLEAENSNELIACDNDFATLVCNATFYLNQWVLMHVFSQEKVEILFECIRLCIKRDFNEHSKTRYILEDDWQAPF